MRVIAIIVVLSTFAAGFVVGDEMETHWCKAYYTTKWGTLPK